MSLLRMDAIIIGGGNTLNMLAIWRAQGIDTVLIKALREEYYYLAAAQDHFVGLFME